MAKQVYMAEDGTPFDTLEQAQEYELNENATNVLLGLLDKLEEQPQTISQSI